jgi:membrane dipeptidase
MLIADAHCDAMLDVIRKQRHLYNISDKGHVDFPRLKKAGVRIQIFALFIESIYKPIGALKRALQMISAYYEEINSYSGSIKHITTKRDLDSLLKEENTLGTLLSIEGGEALEGDLGVLDCLYRLGVRSLGLTWNQRNQIADGVGERATKGGLTKFGAEVVKKMNDLGMLIDLAHISENGFWDVVSLSIKPVIVSHANCQGIFNHPRNLSDQQILALKDTCGVMGITFAPEYIGEIPSIDVLIQHIDYVCQLTGSADNLCLGSDFDGTYPMTPGLEDVTKTPLLIKKLEELGYNKNDIKKIMGENLVTILKANLSQDNPLIP